MDSTPEFAGAICAVLLFGFIPLFALRAAYRATTTSHRLAQLAMFFGLLILFNPEYLFRLASQPTSWLVVAGSIRILIGLTGAICAVAAFAVRFRDRGTGVALPILGLLLSGAQGMVGFGTIFILGGGIASGQPDKSAWSYTDPKHDFRVTLPTSRWQTLPPDTDAVVSFGHYNPRMHTRILAVMVEQTEADLEKEIRKFRERMSSLGQRLSNVQQLDEARPNGNRIVFASATEQSKTGDNIFVASALVWRPARRQIILVIFEGHPWMKSELGRSSENNAFAAAAKFICFSVE